MNPTRRTLLRSAAAASALALPASGAFAQKAEFSLKYANNLPVAHPMNIRAKEMAEAILADTKGRVDIQVFPANQLGSDTDMLSQLRSGGIDFFTLSRPDPVDARAGGAITGVGFAFSDYDTVWKAMDGELGAHVRGADRQGGPGRDGQDLGQRLPPDHLVDQADQHAEDLKGFKIRVPVSPMWTSMFKAFDAAPASINFGEVYSALQTKVVDGQENPLAIISDRQALRSAEVLLADQPHVGRLLVPRQPPRPGRSCRKTCARSSRATSMPPR